MLTERRPEADWLALPGFHWRPLPKREGIIPFWLAELVWWWSQARLQKPEIITQLRPAIEAKNSGSARLGSWHRLLPLATGSWDVIYFPWTFAAATYLPLFAVKPVVVSNRGSQVNIAPHDPTRQSIVERLPETFRGAAAVHCVSEEICRESEAYGLDPAKSWVIRPAVDPGFFIPSQEHKAQSTVFRVVTTGGLSWVKGHEYALIAIRYLLDAGVPTQFTLIGDGPERQRLLYTIDDLDLRQHVTLVGRQSPQQVRTFLQQADVFLLSSVSEGISNAVLEAMACGLAVVTTDCGGMTEAVTDGREGFVVPVRDAAAMAQALETLWQQPALRPQMGQAARQRICAEFTLDKQVDQFNKLFHSVVSQA